MRRSSRHGLAGTVVALLLGVAFALAAALPASAAQGLLHVQAGSLLNVEAGSSSANVEVPGVVKVQAPLPHVEAPAPPVESPSLPLETPRVETPATPTTSMPTPVPVSVGSSSTGQSSSGSQDSAHAASAASTSGATGSSASKAHSGAPRADSNAGGGARSGRGLRSGGHPSARAARAARRRASAAATGASAGSLAPAGNTSTNADATHTASASKRAPSSHKSFASDPLGTIGGSLPFPAPVPDWSRPIILLLLLLAIAFGVRARLATTRARRLQAQHTAMLSDLDEMQKALVPAVPDRLGSLGVSVAYRPADGPAAGGDFYDLFALDDERVAIVLGDVVGHGRQALAQAALTRYTLRAYLQAGLEPRAALALAGSVLSTPGEKRFATVVVAVHDGASGRLTYACAGHPPPIAVGFRAPEPITVCCSAPICCDLPTGHRQTTLSLPASGAMCFFSDGLPEARAGEDLLGRERLGELLGELGPTPSAPALLERIRRETSAAQDDDMVACVITALARPGAGAAQAGVQAQVEELEVDPEMLASPRARAFLEACGLEQARVASTLARASELAGSDGRALVRVERSLAGEASVAVAPCAVPAAPAVADAPGASPELALALSAAR
jgi:hypothetical protein